MGIPKFFRYISERYPCLSEMLKDYQIPEFDNLYLDMNGIIHTCSHPNNNDISFRITQDEIFNNIFHYTEILFGMIQPKKLFFIAIDGVAPRAKINQQRARRFRTAKASEMQEAKEMANGTFNKDEIFDSNCITPGTVFMSQISKQLRDFIMYKVSTDKLWQKCKILFSGSEVVGEGEHKIMDYIRYLKSQENYNPNTRHCLYGLDADLIMLGLCTHERNFSLLREEVKFGKKQKRVLTPEETKFCLLHLSLLRDYLSHEFSPIKDKLSFPFDIEHIIDDWVLMGFLVGNDFIPNLPNLNIHSGALPLLYHAYMEVLPTLDGYINESGKLRLDRFEVFMERLSRIDVENFAEYYCDFKYLEAKINKYKNTTSDGQMSLKDDDSSQTCSPSIKVDDLLKPFVDMEMQDSDDEKAKYSQDELDDESDSDTYNTEFILHKRDYYMNKLEYEDVNEDVLRSQAEVYVRAIQWNLHYYYDGCCSWSWYYPHHYAPYISDIKGFKDLKLEFELGEPFQPFQQLLAVLPPYSRKLLPEPLQSLLVEEESPIIDYYPSDFKTDLNGKKQDWEAVVLIPFIDEKLLTNAMKPYYEKLTEEERERNKHGPMYMYSYDKDVLGLCHTLGNVSVIESHSHVEIINREDIYVPKEKLVKGLHPRVNLDVYYFGFPTLKYIQHIAELKQAKVKIFEQPSRNDNMILYIQQQEEQPNIKQLAASLLNKTIYVEWPYLREAHVVGVSDSKKKIHLIVPQLGYSSNNILEEELKGACATQWNSEIKSINETYLNRFGIDIGKTNILIHAQPLIGSKYIFAAKEKLSVEKQWQEIPTFYAYQTILKDIPTNSVVPMYKTIDEIFTPGSTCFMLGHPHYGAMGEIVGPKANINSGRIKISVKIVTEPDLTAVKQAYAESKTQYIYGSTAAQRLGISSHLLSRITGTIYIAQNNPREVINIGLNLKFNKRNEEVPGYTKKEYGYGQWLYSKRAIELIRDYMAKFPNLFERLAQNITVDVYSEEELFDKSSDLSSIVAWLKEQHFRGVESRPCGMNVLESEIVQKIEVEVDKYNKAYNHSNKIVMQVKPQLLFNPELYSRQLAPDPKCHTRLLDRIVCVRGSFTVPVGYKGTIIGIQEAKITIDSFYDVLFDKSFLGGLTFNGCSANRGYKLAITDFINISHGERVEHGKSGMENTSNEPTEMSWRRHQNTKIQIQSNNKPTSQQNKPPSNELKTSKPLSSEFQQLWNELHKKEDSSGSSKTPTKIIVKSNEMTEISSNLKSNEKNKQIYARQQRKEIKDNKNSICYYTLLLNHYQMLGLGVPRYNYFVYKQTTLIQAQIILPDAKVFIGDPGLNIPQATQNVAKKVYEELNLDKIKKPDTNILLKPSQQWVNMRQNNPWLQNIRPPPVVLPYMSKPYHTSENPIAHCSKWNMKVPQNPGFPLMTPPPPPQPHNIQIQIQERQTTNNEPKSEVKNATSFVPLQAQKKSRKINMRQTNKETLQNNASNSQSTNKQSTKQQPEKKETFPKPPKTQQNVNKTLEKEVRIQNNSQPSPKLPKSGRPKRSRVAAKFVSPPATNGSGQ
ncbi:PREDICTED: 5'-3' exoribonuclease 1 isoform X2 [Polistes dominula]|uniref:5'-3' exoribonuclease 1 n=1 Tax=Polistes dominula TaxID=743375 RepID=A0ABM1J976_POLDO|nr:PREDICTED: 5'-3' exoribonuclease 1 isoform X2 [Polistes dominula]